MATTGRRAGWNRAKRGKRSEAEQARWIQEDDDHHHGAFPQQVRALSSIFIGAETCSPRAAAAMPTQTHTPVTRWCAVRSVGTNIDRAVPSSPTMAAQAVRRSPMRILVYIYIYIYFFFFPSVFFCLLLLPLLGSFFFALVGPARLRRTTRPILSAGRNALMYVCMHMYVFVCGSFPP